MRPMQPSGIGSAWSGLLRCWAAFAALIPSALLGVCTRRLRARRFWLLSACIAIGLPCRAEAHALFTAYIRHGILVTVGARHFDIEVDLTFFEEWSGRERAAMDSDADGTITRPEVELYVKKLAPDLARQIRLCVGSRELALAPLYAPEVDLLGSRQAGPAHHRLRLFFFAADPAPLRAGDEILIEDRLWPAAKALGFLQADGRDGCALEAEKRDDPGFAPLRAGEARLFKVRCLQPPAPEASSAHPTRPMASAAEMHPPSRP